MPVFTFAPQYHNVYSLPTEAAYGSCDQAVATELTDGTTGSYSVSIHCFTAAALGGWGTWQVWCYNPQLVHNNCSELSKTLQVCVQLEVAELYFSTWEIMLITLLFCCWMSSGYQLKEGSTILLASSWLRVKAHTVKWVRKWPWLLRTELLHLQLHLLLLQFQHLSFLLLKHLLLLQFQHLSFLLLKHLLLLQFQHLSFLLLKHLSLLWPQPVLWFQKLWSECQCQHLLLM